MLKIIKNTFLLSLFFLFVNCDQSSQNKNNSNGMITVKVFSYLSMVGFILISISILFAEDLMK